MSEAKQSLAPGRWWALVRGPAELPVLFSSKQDALENRDDDEYLVEVLISAAPPSSRPRLPAEQKQRRGSVLRAFDDSKGRGVCRTCGAAIWWMLLVSGKRHPFNEAGDGGTPPPAAPDESQDGRRVLVIDAANSHFATCKDAKDWKRKP